MKKTRKYHTTEHKKKLVDEYVSGTSTVEAIAAREKLDRAQIYKWKAQLENRARDERIETLEASGHNADDIRRIIELEDELAAAKVKIADLALANDLLKKIHPNFQFGKRSSGYAELKRATDLPSKKRAK
jgi:transposase-like protein